MTRYDAFNGDADGICALLQLRLAEPARSVLITGVKSDIALLGRAPARKGDQVTVLDISIDANRQALLALLAGGVSVLYVDHHSNAGIPAHPLLRAMIDPSPDVCTGMLVDRYLAGRFRIWAVVAAFGDNFDAQGERLALSLALDGQEIAALRELGICLNYNAYGNTTSDLNVDPARLYQCLYSYADPFEFIRAEPIFQRLRHARDRDLDCASRLGKRIRLSTGEVVILPDSAWSRRVRGIYANELAHACPAKAHALLVEAGADAYTVSVRAPLEGIGSLRGADSLCRQFDRGGGRPAAASIARLPQQQLGEFIRAFEDAFGAR